jgi:methyl-accepting chemotaxis protein
MFIDEGRNTMRLQTKITFCIIPMVLLSIFVLGMWSIKKANDSLHKSIFLYMNTIMDSYLSDINKLNDLLVKNGLNKVDAFVSEYKQNAFKAGRSIKLPNKSHIFVMDTSGQLLFCSIKSDKKMMESVWGPTVIKRATPSEPGHVSHVIEAGKKKLYVTRQFKPWDWIIVFTMSDQAVHDAEKQIRNATIGIASICSILSILMILIVFRRFFVVPITIIGKFASAIAKGENLKQITIFSNDELGDLARNMKAMSDSIQEHQAEIKKSRDELEIRVKERTEKLENALSEIKTLRGIVPICSHCKKIRDDKGYWNQLEAYIQEHSDAEFSHSICKECAKEHYPDMDIYDDDREL